MIVHQREIQNKFCMPLVIFILLLVCLCERECVCVCADVLRICVSISSLTRESIWYSENSFWQLLLSFKHGVEDLTHVLQLAQHFDSYTVLLPQCSFDCSSDDLLTYLARFFNIHCGNFTYPDDAPYDFPSQSLNLRFLSKLSGAVCGSWEPNCKISLEEEIHSQSLNIFSIKRNALPC